MHVKAGIAPTAGATRTVARVRNEPSPATDEAAVPRPPAPRAAAGKKGALNAPMPGVILEVNVKAGDIVTRGQQVAILDAMKMHNVIGAPRAGTIAEVFVSAGQNVNHGDAIVSFTGG
jgi:biotin carboxyl carrier protein